MGQRLVFAIFGFVWASACWGGDLRLEDVQARPHLYFVESTGAFFRHGNPRAQEIFYRKFLDFDGKPQVCLLGDRIYGGVVKACVKKVSVGQRSMKCVKWESSAEWAPIVGTKKVCVQYRDQNSTECLRTKEVTYDLTANLVAQVYDNQRDEDRVDIDQGLIGEIRFQLPKCRYADPAAIDRAVYRDDVRGRTWFTKSIAR